MIYGTINIVKAKILKKYLPKNKIKEIKEG
jgi:hypothetical protein